MITKIYFYDALPQAVGVSRKFAGRGLHAVDGFSIEELSIPGTYAVRITHPQHGSWDVHHVRYEVFYDDRKKPPTPDQVIRMGLPSELINASIDNVQDSASPTIRNFCSNLISFLDKGVGLILVGGPGVGKSGCAAVLVREAWDATHSAYFVTVSDLRELIKGKVNYDAQTTVLERCRDVRLLVLDGLREEDSKDPFFDASSLAGLIEHRTQRNKSTIITTRMTPSVLNGVFPYAMSLLRAKSPVLAVDGENFRSKQVEDVKKAVIR